MATEEVVYKRRPRDLGEKLLLLQRNDQLCDVAIIVNEKRIPVHSNVMVSYSDHFNNIFLKSQRKEVTLNDTNEENLLALIEYCYTGIITTSIENARGVLLLAKSLLIPTAIDGISKSLINKLDAVNCLKLWNFAQNESLMLLNKGALDYAQRHYEQVSKSEDFLALTTMDLKKLLEFKTDELESVVYDSVKNWVSHDNASRKVHFTSLIGQIKLEKIPQNILQTDSLSMCTTNKECSGKYLNALDIQNGNKVFKERPKTTFLAVGADHYRTTKIMEIYDIENKEWREILNIESKKVCAVATTLDNKLITIGGKLAEKIVNTVESYDFQTMETETLEPMKYPRFKASVVKLEGSLFVIGGYDDKALNYVEKYSSSSAKWEEVASMSTPRRDCGSEVLDGKIYVVGGFGGFANNEYLSTMEIYDPLTDKWSMGAVMNEKRGGPGVAVVGKFMYVVGGHNYQDVYSKTAEKYDPKLDKWTMIQSMSISRYCPSAGNFDGKIIVAGGWSDRNRILIVESYNVENDKWDIIEPLKNGRGDCNLVEVPLRLVDEIINKKSYNTLLAVGDTSYLGAQQLDVYDILDRGWKTVFMKFSGMRRMYASTMLNEKLMIIGGRIFDDTVTNSVEIYNCKIGNCENFPSMKYKKYRAKAVQLRGDVYVIGGHDGDNCSPHVEKWNSSTESWTEVAALSVPRDACEAAILNGKIYVAGGFDKKEGFLSSMETYDPVKNNWKMCKSMQEKRKGFAMAAVGGYLYALGGYNLPGAPSITVEKYDPNIDQWTMFQSMTMAKAYHSAGNLNGTLVVGGGEHGVQLVFSSRTEYYDENEGKWNFLSSMSKVRNLFTLVEVPWHVANLVVSRAN